MELRSEHSKNDLADALVMLMQKTDYSKISIQDIVDKAGLSRMAYYRNFASKDEVLIFYLDRVTDQFIQETKVDFDALSLPDYITVLFSHLKRQALIGQLLLKNDLLHYIKNEFDRIFEGKAKTPNEVYTYSFIAGGLFNIYSKWLGQGCDRAATEHRKN